DLADRFGDVPVRDARERNEPRRIHGDPIELPVVARADDLEREVTRSIRNDVTGEPEVRVQHLDRDAHRVHALDARPGVVAGRVDVALAYRTRVHARHSTTHRASPRREQRLIPDEPHLPAGLFGPRYVRNEVAPLRMRHPVYPDVGRIDDVGVGVEDDLMSRHRTVLVVVDGRGAPEVTT